MYSSSVRIDKKLRARIERIARRQNISLMEVIRKAINDYLAEHTKAAIQARDLKRIDETARRRNREASETLKYQNKPIKK